MSLSVIFIIFFIVFLVNAFICDHCNQEEISSIHLLKLSNFLSSILSLTLAIAGT